MPKEDDSQTPRTEPLFFPPPAAYQDIPKVIGPYKVEALLDTGGMSTLYLGTHPTSKDPIAIKILSEKYLSHPKIVQRFLNEAEIISLANHPNIIKMHGHGEWEGGLYIAMEYVEGVSLRKTILTTPISLKKALKIILDIAYAICHLHTHGVIHRDLKPENILVTEEGVIKVIDFGIAQLVTASKDLEASDREKIIGTPFYISPEQKENPENVSFPSDIYSLGIISYELILGRLSRGQLHLSLLPQGMQSVLSRCLQPDPGHRYLDIVDFITDVSAYLNSEAIHKDSQLRDHISGLSEDLQQFHQALLPQQTPQWSPIAMGLARTQSQGSSSVFYDFFSPSSETYSFFLADSKKQGAESFFFSACLKGMIQVLHRWTQRPLEIVTTLNDLLLKEQIGPVFNVNFLLLQQKDQRLHYVSTGYGNLWHIPHDTQLPVNCSLEQLPVGAAPSPPLKEHSIPWETGDILVVNTFSLEGTVYEQSFKSFEKEFIATLKENADLAPQQLAEHILRKAKLSISSLPEKKAFTVLCLKNGT